MISRFFIDRPIFASVLSIVIVILGVVALSQLPIAQYPDVAPPTVQVTANSQPGSVCNIAQATQSWRRRTWRGREGSAAATWDCDYRWTAGLCLPCRFCGPANRDRSSCCGRRCRAWRTIADVAPCCTICCRCGCRLVRQSSHQLGAESLLRCVQLVL